MPVFRTPNGEKVSVTMFGFGSEFDISDVGETYDDYDITRDAQEALQEDMATKLWSIGYENGATEVVTDEQYRTRRRNKYE